MAGGSPSAVRVMIRPCTRQIPEKSESLATRELLDAAVNTGPAPGGPSGVSGCKPTDAAPTEAGAFDRTDPGNGEHFAGLYGDRVRFGRRRRWLVWDGHWRRDDGIAAVRRSGAGRPAAR